MLKKTNRFLALVLAVLMLATMMPMEAVLADVGVTSPSISFTPNSAAQRIDLPAINLGGEGGTGADPEGTNPGGDPDPDGGLDLDGDLDPDGGLDPEEPIETEPPAIDPNQIAADLDAMTDITVSLVENPFLELVEGATIDISIGELYSVTLSATHNRSFISVPVYAPTDATADQIAAGEADMPDKINYKDMPLTATIQGESSALYAVSASWASDYEVAVSLFLGMAAVATLDAASNMTYSVTKFWYGATMADITNVTLNFGLSVPSDDPEARVIMWPFELGTERYEDHGSYISKAATIEIPTEIRGLPVTGSQFMFESVSGRGAYVGGTWNGSEGALYNTIRRSASLDKVWAPADEGKKYLSAKVTIKSNNPDYNGNEYTLLRSNGWHMNLGMLPMGGKDSNGDYVTYWYEVDEVSLTKNDGSTVADPSSIYKITCPQASVDPSTGYLKLVVINEDENISSKGKLTIRKLWDGKQTYTDIGSGTKPNVSFTVYLTCSYGNHDHDRVLPNIQINPTTGIGVINDLPLADQEEHPYNIRIEENISNTNFRPEYRSLIKVDGGYEAVVNNVSLKVRLEGTKYWSPEEPEDADPILVQLYRDNKPLGDPIEVTGDNDWKYLFLNLDRFDPVDGHVYVYTVREVSPPDGYTWYNSGNDLVNIAIGGGGGAVALLSKTWVGDAQQNYPSVTIQLVDVTDSADGVIVATWDVPGGSSFSSTVLSGLELDPDRIYVLRETTDSEGKWSFISREPVWKDGNFLIMQGINMLTNASGTEIEVRVRKKWNESDLWEYAGDRQNYVDARNAKFELYRDGELIDTMDADSGIQVFDGLPKFNPDTGAEYSYTVKEVGVGDGYISSLQITKEGVWEFTNKLKVKDITYTKHFEFDGLDVYDIEECVPADATLTFALKRWKSVTGSEAQAETVNTFTLTRDQYKTLFYEEFKFEGLPVYSPYDEGSDPHVEEYVYKLEEIDIPEEDGTPIFDVQYEGTNIYNTFQGKSLKTNVTVIKEWERYQSYPPDCIPKAIQFRVYEEKTKTWIERTYEIEGSPDMVNGWSTTIELERYVTVNGQKVDARYTITETHVMMMYNGQSPHAWTSGVWLPINDTEDDRSPFWNRYTDGVSVPNQVTIYNAPLFEYEEKPTTVLRVYKDWADKDHATGGASPKFPGDADNVVFNVYADGSSLVSDTPESNDGGIYPHLDNLVIYNVPAKSDDIDAPEIEYTATENLLPGYATTLKEDFTWDPINREWYAVFLNTYSPEKVDIKVNKRFIEPRPSFLLAWPDPEDIEVRWKIEGVSTGDWTPLGDGYEVIFENLTMYTDEDSGIPVVYTIEEKTTINGVEYIFTCGVFDLTKQPNKDLNENGLYIVEVTNEVKDTTSIKGTKVWLDENGNHLDASKHPASITLELYRDTYALGSDGKKTGNKLNSGEERVPDGSFTLSYTGPNASNVYSWSINDLERYGYDSTNGVLVYEYYVKEVPITGFDTSYKMGAGEVSPPATTDGVRIENRQNPPLGKLQVTKIWQDHLGQVIDWVRDVDVTLHQDYEVGGKAYSNPYAYYTLTEDEQFYVFENLPLYGYIDGELVAYTYTVSEGALAGFEEPVYSPATGVTPGNEPVPNIDIINKRVQPGSIVVVKKWAGDSASVRPASIKVTLTGYIGETDNITDAYVPVTKTLYLNAADVDADGNYTWTDGVFNGLPKYDNVGNAIRYVLTEEALVNYGTVISPAGVYLTDKTAPFVITITNTRGGEFTQITVNKHWRPVGVGHPANVTLQMYRVGKAVEGGAEIVLEQEWGDAFLMNPSNPAQDDWTWTSANNLPKYATVTHETLGDVFVEYTYYVREVGNPYGFDVSYSDDDRAYHNGTITNTSTIEEISLAYQKLWLDTEGTPITGRTLPEAQLQLKRKIVGTTTVEDVGEPYTVGGTNANQLSGIKVPPFEYVDGVLREYEYYFEEVSVPAGYVATYKVGNGTEHTDASKAIVGGGQTVTVTNREDDGRASLRVVKAWQDANGDPLAGDAPYSIDFTVVGKVGGEDGTVVYQSVSGALPTATEPPAMEMTFINLPVWYQGEKVTYYVNEIPVTPTSPYLVIYGSRETKLNVNNAPEIASVTLVNRIKIPDTGSLIVEKTWAGELGWPANVGSIAFTVYSSLTRLTDDWDFVDEGVLTEGARVTFGNLPVEDLYGNTIYYKVVETEDDSKFELTGNSGGENGVALVAGEEETITLTNTLNDSELGELKVIKAWRGGAWPADVDVITVSYQSDLGDYSGSYELKSTDTNWSHTFEDLPVTYNGAVITYTVTESWDANSRVTWVGTLPTPISGMDAKVQLSPSTGGETTTYSAVVTFTNDVVTEEGKLTVRKAWEGGSWPTSFTGSIGITVTPIIKGVPGSALPSKTITSGTPYCEFGGLSVMDYDGNPITYRVSESIVSTDPSDQFNVEFVGVVPAGLVGTEYTEVTMTTAGREVIFTNRWLPPVGSLTVIKAWDGGVWPANVESIEFYVNGASEVGVTSDGPHTLTPSDTDGITINDLPVRDAEGDEITYTVVETPQYVGVPQKEKFIPTYQYPDGVKLVGGGNVNFTVTNEPGEPPLGDLYVKKLWVEGEDQKLMSWPMAVDGVTITVTSIPSGFAPDPAQVVLKDGEIDYLFENLRVYDDDDELIEYTVTEIYDGAKVKWVSTLVGATPMDTEYAIATLIAEGQTDVTFTNKLADPDKGQLKVTKVWKDVAGNVAEWPAWVEYIDIELIGGAGSDVVHSETARLDKTNYYKTFSDLDRTTDDLVTPIVYRVVETVVPAEFSQKPTTGVGGQQNQDDYEVILREAEDPEFEIAYEIILNNTALPQLGKLTINKEWLNADGEPVTDEFVFPITYSLVGKVGDDVVREVATDETLDSGNNWTASYDNLPLYKGNDEITYYLEETSTSDYYKLTTNTGESGIKLVANEEQKATLTNQLNQPRKAKLKVVKDWGTNVPWPENAVINFSVTGTTTRGGTVYTYSGTLDKDHPSWTSGDLDVDHQGEKIVYTVTETLADAFTHNGIAPNGITLTQNATSEIVISNSYKRISIKVIKQWLEDDENGADTRGEVEIELVATPAVSYAPLKVTLDGAEAPAWEHTFQGLPQYVYDSVSKEYVLVQYEVRENSKPDRYTQLSITQPTMEDGVKTYSVTVENELESAELSGKKTWVNTTTVEGQTVTIGYPDEITVTLMNSDDTPVEPAPGIDPVRIARAPGYEWEYRLLPGSADDYYVVETPLLGYVADDVLDMDITNTPDTTEYTVSKAWNIPADMNQSDVIPKELKVTLHSTPESVLGTGGIEYALNAENGWTHTFENLPTHTYVGGKVTPITYSATEETVLGYDQEEIEGEAGIAFANTLTTFDIEVEKTWIEGDYKQRPDEIEVILKRRLASMPNDPGEVVGSQTITVDENDTQSVVFDGLPKYAMVRMAEGVWGVPYVYFAEESPVAGYAFRPGNTVSADQPNSNRISIANELIETNVTIVKKWDDANEEGVYDSFGFRPATLKFILLQNGEVYDDTRVIDVSDGKAEYTVKYERLPAKDENGDDYVYTVEEDLSELGEYAATIGQPSFYEEDNVWTFEIVNKLELIDIRLIKSWADDADYTGYRVKGTLKFTVTGTAEGGYSATYECTMPNGGDSAVWVQDFTGLPKTANNGQLIEYTVVEEMVNDEGESLFAYETSYSNDGVLLPVSNPARYEATITNKLRRITLGVDKIWADKFGDVDNKYQMRPDALIVHLFADKVTVDTVTLNARNGWYAAFKSLPIYRPGAKGIGDKIDYSTEEEIKGCYIGTWNPTIVLRNGVYHIELTNTLQVTNLKLNKEWLGDEGFETLRPSSITLTIYSKLEDGTDVFAPLKVQLFADKKWEATIANLPVLNKDGKRIIYTILEDAVPGYQPSYTQPALSGGILVGKVVNTMQTGRVRVIKNWTGITRAQSPAVQISLYADGVLINTRDYTNTNYDMTFDNLPMYNASTGNRIVYRAVENTAALPANHYYVSATTTTPEGYLAQIVVLNEYSTTPPPPTPPGGPGTPEVNPAEFVSLGDGDIPLSMGGEMVLHLGDCFD